MISEMLMRAGRYEAALEVIARAERRFPRNRALDGAKGEAEGVLAARRAEQTKPEVDLPVPVFVETTFFKRIDDLLAQGQWSEAMRVIREVQQDRPTWLKAREADVFVRMMRAPRGAQSRLEMTLAARQLLDGTIARAQIVVDYAVELRNQGDTEPAVMLLREVIRNVPNHAFARRLLDDWTAPPESTNAGAEG